MPLSAIDTISVAFEHTKQQLFRPFRWDQWLRLAALGLLTGELSSGGGCGTGGHSFSVPIPTPSQTPRGSDHFLTAQQFAPNFSNEIAALLILALLLFGAIVLAWMYVGSVYRFILIDSIIAKKVSIRAGWHKWHAAGRRFFLWRVVFQFVGFMLLVISLGVPLGLAAMLGWFSNPKAHLIPIVLAATAFIVWMILLGIVSLLVFVLAKDFMAPIMALENLGFADSWARLFTMMKGDRGGYAGYIGMKVVLVIASGIVFGILIGLVMLLILIPVGGLTVVAVIMGKTAGLVWNAETITLMIVGGCILLALILCVTALLSVPVTVYFPAYSIYFFASRYPKLDAWLHPPPQPVPPPFTPALEAPPIPPLLGPEPIG